MIVANESTWATEDLEALLKSVTEQPKFKRKTWMSEDTLVLFITSCAKTKKADYDDEADEIPDTADYDISPKRYEDTIIIRIRSAKALVMEPLDRLAHIGECVQHMSTTNLREVAKAIWSGIGRYWPEDSELLFADSMNMRSRPKITRSKVALKREIAALRWKQYKMERKYNKHLSKLIAQEKVLDAKLDQMPD